MQEFWINTFVNQTKNVKLNATLRMCYNGTTDSVYEVCHDGVICDRMSAVKPPAFIRNEHAAGKKNAGDMAVCQLSEPLPRN